MAWEICDVRLLVVLCVAAGQLRLSCARPGSTKEPGPRAGRSAYNLAKTPLKAAQAPLARASTIHWFWAAHEAAGGGRPSRPERSWSRMTSRAAVFSEPGAWRLLRAGAAGGRAADEEVVPATTAEGWEEGGGMEAVPGAPPCRGGAVAVTGETMARVPIVWGG